VRRVILVVASTVVGLVLLLGFKTESASNTAPTAAAIAPNTADGSSSSSSTTSGAKTVTGSSVDTRYGPVQVKITAVNGKITSAQAVDYPQKDPRDQEINSVAIPQLQQETISASSANIDMVSGATYTSQGYIQSLQSALDQL
jgi:uncharacterized protein with FMN-binding domain